GLSFLVIRPREGEDPAALVPGNRGDDVRRGAEAVKAQALSVAGQPKRPVADQAGAEQGSRLEGGIALRECQGVALIDHGVLRVPAVHVVAGEACVVTEVLAPGAAVPALSVRPSEPGNPDAPALPDDCTDDLVAKHERQLRVRQ